MMLRFSALACLMGPTLAACGPFEAVRIHLTASWFPGTRPCSTYLSVGNGGVEVDAWALEAAGELTVDVSDQVSQV
eukprot:COSAG02_NODE_15175_length_1197_cov_1.088342_2_plen_76_part_00